jgi:hypothetical protein
MLSSSPSVWNIGDSLRELSTNPMAPAGTAEPLLASAVVTSEELERLFDNVIGGKPLLTRKHGVLRTGQRSVDEAVGGGLESGRVVGVWGDAGSGGAEVGSPDKRAMTM